MSEPVRLYEFTKEEWRVIARGLRPEWTDEDFDQAWEEFQEMKRRKPLH